MFNNIYKDKKIDINLDLFRDIPNGICNGLNCSLDDVRQVINVLWYDYADTWILDNHTLKIKNPTKILKEGNNGRF